MIQDALLSLAEMLDAHVKMKTGQPSSASKMVVLTNVSDGNGIAIPQDTIGLSLVNIEEERILKAQRTKYINDAGQMEFKNPPIKINLYVLISANHLRKQDNGNNTTRENYYEGLKRLSYVIEFFQARNVFTPENTPALALTFDDQHINMDDEPTQKAPGKRLEKLIVELYSYSFEQMYNFWSVLGVSYLPSVLYRVRLITIQEDEAFGADVPVTQIHMQSKHQ